MKLRRLMIPHTIAMLLALHCVVTYADTPTLNIPEVNGFVPTQMADIEDPHPFTNRVIVTEPVANTYGTAEITYPIDIPAGRNNLQPNIDLTYSSSNGASVFGYGWTMQQPAISIDTRWGVPRYNTRYETEIYTLNGAQIVQKDGNPDLTLSYQAHTQLQRRNGNVLFMSRDTKNKDVITRHGNSPRNYWWSVVDRNGTTYYYGKYQSDNQVNNACVLTDSIGNIGYWALTEVVDLYGNYIIYEYNKDEDTDIFLTYIYYAGHRNTQGATDVQPSYRIRLHYNTDGYRDSIQSDCRLGFVRKIDRRICYIDESDIEDVSDTTYSPFIRYILNVSSAEEQSIPYLRSISKYRMRGLGSDCDAAIQICGIDGCYVPMECSNSSAYLFNSTTFEYNVSSVFDSAEQIIADANYEHTNLSETRNMDWSLGGTLTIGVGPDTWNTNISAGGNYDYSKSKGDVDMTLMDLNGDGLADKIYIKNDSIYYRKQIQMDTICFFSQEYNTGIPAKSLSHEVSKTNRWGLQAGAAVPGEMAGANISGGWSVTNTQISSYFADVNGDGLPDYIDDGIIYFNRLNSQSDFHRHQNEYNVVVDSSHCAPYFYYDGQVNASINCHVDTVIIGSFTATERVPNYYPYNADCPAFCYFYINGDYSYLSQCEECLQTTPVYLDENLDVILIFDEAFCTSPNFYYNMGASRLCPECIDYLTDQYGRDIEAYLECAESCQAADTALYWELNGCCISSYECPTDECQEYARDMRSDCEDICINGVEICEECVETCINGGPYLCNECKRNNGCKGGVDDFEIFDLCNTYGWGSCYCVNALYEAGGICDECLETCKFHPELCYKCINRNCEYISLEPSVSQQIEEWENSILSSNPNAQFIENGLTVTAYETQTICQSHEEEISPDMEAVRVWVAPHNGTVRIESYIQLQADNSAQRTQSRSADGVRCIIQHDKQVQVIPTPEKHLSSSLVNLIDETDISANDYTQHINNYRNISVKKGDILSFHLLSKSSHAFDNVNWSQRISYSNSGESYNSSGDFICSSSEAFQYNSIGNANIEFWADVKNGGNAEVAIMIGDTTYTSYDITTTQHTYESCLINSICPNSYNPLYLTLNSSNPSKVRVRAKITFTYTSEQNTNDTIIKWIVPKVSFQRNNNEIHDDVYYDLFGPLYNGWGQYAFNNKYGTTIIPLDSLFNPFRRTYEEHHNDTAIASYSANILSIAEMDTNQLMESPELLEAAFSQQGLFNPLGQMWIEMQADAENYQWEAYGKIARVGQTVMSNTRDESQQASATVFNIGDFIFYDNVVPKSTDGTRIMTIRKESRTKQWELAFGANIAYAGVGRSKSRGIYQLLADYMDMNGDRYPDIIRDATIQYTKPWGGLGDTFTTNTYSHETKTATEGFSFSGNFGKTVKQPGSAKNDRFMTSASGGINASRTYSNSESSLMLLDVNADGLPDKLVISGDTTFIYLNLGYRFKLFKIIPGLDLLSSTHSEATNRNVGFSASNYWGVAVEELLSNNGVATHSKKSMYQASISAGCSSSASENTTTARLIDINGDGRLDLVQYDPTGLWAITNILNNNTNIVELGDSLLQRSITSNAGLNLALTGGYTFFGVMKVCAGLQTTPVNISETFGTHDLIDMNGDGLPDLVRVDDNKIYVRYNNSGKRGLLKSIKNINNYHIDLDYTLSPPTTEQPFRHMLLTSIRSVDDSATADAGIPIMEKRIVYEDPHYDPSERQSYGYGSVTTYDMYPASDNDSARIYRKHVQRYKNQEYAEHGKLIYDALLDSLDNLYTEYELGTTYYDASGHETDNTCHDTKIRVGKETHFNRYYEGTAEPITTAKIYDYDSYHNVIRYEDLGDSLIANDDLLTTFTYEHRTQYVDQNLISLPIDVLIKAAGQNVRRIRSEYTTQGKLSKQVLSSLINSNDSSVTDYLYNDLGLLTHVTLPPNHNNQRGTISIIYDSLTYSLPQKITNHFGHTLQYTYSTQWQKPLQVISPAGDSISYGYDKYGRLTTITAPLERLDESHSVEYVYGGINHHTCQLYVDTKTYTEGDSTLQRSLYDSRGLLLQHQKSIASGFTVKERKSYDCFGRVIKTYSPTMTDDLLNSYISQNRQLVASYTYDILDRQTSVLWNDNNHNTSTIQYLLGNDYWNAKRFKTVTTDENGNEWQNYTSPQGWLTTTVTPDSAITRYTYDALGHLTGSTDPDGLTTTYIYDGLGRRLQCNHPDAGITQWQYDPTGNIITSATQQQTEDATHTEYVYDYERLVSVHQPAHAGLDITYTYDSVGRIASRSDITGVEQFMYDQMGNITQSDRLIALPSENSAYRFTTDYEYDSFGRMRSITFPDRTWARYSYADGLLRRIYTHRPVTPYYEIETKGLPRPRTINFLNDCEYNEYEMPVYYKQGKFTTEYTYDSTRLWLVNKVTYNTDDDTRTLQLLDYTYDGVGNIVSIEQTADTIHWLGGAYIQQFIYDTQNRLTRADMLSDYLGEYSNYNLSYSPSGMIGTKNCDDMLWTYWHGYCSINNSITNHQVRSIYDMENDATTFYTWDAAGRLQNIYEPCTGDISHYRWNEYGQMAAMVDNGNCAFYGYDGNGERTYKLTGNTALDQYNAGQQAFHAYLNNAVIYVNPYLTITPRNYMRHIFNGSQRIATEIGTDDLTDCIDTTAVGAERMANARAYMQSLLSESIELEPDTAATFVDIDGEAYDELQWQCADDALAWNVTVLCDTDIILPILRRDSGTADTRITGTYYYHTDHLGSASWITHGDEPVQFIHYMPYGEMWYNQRGSAYNERYKYTGKERDEETGNDYFGARYYAPNTPMWLSPDPLMDKYPGISPYAYCNWNPMKYVDPDGKNCKLTVKENTITISAKYYSLPKDYNSVLRATAFWNNQKDLKYIATDGKVYSVRFELKAYQSNNPKNEILSGTISKNTYGVVRSLGKDANGNLRTGVTINNQHIKVIEARESGTTGAHEVGHSLMTTHNQDYEHTESGIMTPHVNDNNRSKRVTQETVNTIVESNGFNSKNQSLWSRIKSFFE